MFTKLQWYFFALAIFVAGGFFFAFYERSPSFEADTSQASLLDGQDIAFEKLGELGIEAGSNDMWLQSDERVFAIGQQVSDIRLIVGSLRIQADANRKQYAEQAQEIKRLAEISASQTAKSNDTLDVILSNILGDPIGQTFGDQATIKVFSLEEAGYRGYMAKVKLHDPGAVQLVLSHDSVGNDGETTSDMAERKNATLAINGGGFARGNDGKLYPMGITVVDGNIETFYSIDQSFIGFDKKGNLVGGEVTSREQIKEMGVMQGATFVPTLLKDGKKLDIPAKWQNKREPRTLIGHFTNGDILMIVIDGRQSGYSKGITLEEAQDKLLDFNVRDAYNLDGGGSSTFYYKGEVLNRPSDGRERKMTSAFIIRAD